MTDRYLAIQVVMMPRDTNPMGLEHDGLTSSLWRRR
jgi:hypothetical protein